jgi:acyl dehydratase
MVVLARQLYFEAVKVGDELPPLVKSPVDRVQIARYAGASGDFGPLHVDEPFARNAGFPSVLVPGMLAMGFLGELAVEWLRGARLRRFTGRFVKIIWPGDVITSRGRVADRRFEDGGRYLVDIELWAENQRGELVVRGVLSAQLYYNAEDEARQRAGQPPLVVKQAEEEERLARLSRGSPPARPPSGTPRPAAPAPVRPVTPPVRPAAPAARPEPSTPPSLASATKPAAAARRVEEEWARKAASKEPAKKKAAAKSPAKKKAAAGKPAKKGGKPAGAKSRGKRR